MPIVLRLFLAFLFVGLFVPNDAFAAENLLTNPDFEDGLNSWTKNVSTLTAVATGSAEQVYSGTQSAYLKGASTSTKYLYQIVSATGSATYLFSGWAKVLSGSAGAYLRATEDATSHDSTHSAQTDWTYLSVTFTTATSTASLKLKINLDPNDASASALVWDTLVLQRILPLTIDYSLLASVSADQQFSVPLTITNASFGTKYFLKGVSGESVSTFNNAWLAWNGSWTDMPSVTTDSSGSGSAVLTARFNSSTTALGQNNFLVRIRKDGTQDNLDASPSAIFINPPPASSSSTTTTNNTPSFDFPLPESASVGAQFDINAKITNLLTDTKYYLKARIGPDSSHLTHGQTNNNGWLSDNDSWVKFPQILADSSGKWEGKVTTKLSDDEPVGTYKLQLRVRKVGDDNNFDSDLKEMKFTSKAYLPSPVASPSGNIKLTTLSEVLGTATESGEASFSAILDTSSPDKNDSLDPAGNNLISWGMTALGAALSTSFFRRRV